MECLPNFCAQQCIDDGVGLFTPHNLHRTDYMKGKQQTSYSQLTARFLWAQDLGPIYCSPKLAAKEDQCYG